MEDDAVKRLTDDVASMKLAIKASRLVKSLGDKHLSNKSFRYHPGPSKALNDFKLRRDAEREGLIPTQEVVSVIPLRKRQT